MGYIPGRSYLVAYKLEGAYGDAIGESADGVTPATLGSPPSSPTLIGYTNTVPDFVRAFNNKKGRSSGTAYPVYDTPGVNRPSMGINLMLGSVPFLMATCLRANDETLPWVSLYLARNGEDAHVMRFSKCGGLDLNFQEGDAQELTAAAHFEGTAHQVGATLSATSTQIKALSTPLMWHDVRNFVIPGPGGGTTNMRQDLMGMSLSINHNLERKSPRNFWGNDEPLSLTSSDIIEHLVDVTGNIRLHGEIDESLLTGAWNAQQWGDVVIQANNNPSLGGSTGQLYYVTAKGVVPDVVTMSGVEIARQMETQISILADNVLIAQS